jgi:hypothetical protein
MTDNFMFRNYHLEFTYPRVSRYGILAQAVPACYDRGLEGRKMQSVDWC